MKKVSSILHLKLLNPIVKYGNYKINPILMIEKS